MCMFVLMLVACTIAAIYCTTLLVTCSHWVCRTFLFLATAVKFSRAAHTCAGVVCMLVLVHTRCVLGTTTSHGVLVYNSIMLLRMTTRHVGMANKRQGKYSNFAITKKRMYDLAVHPLAFGISRMLLDIRVMWLVCNCRAWDVHWGTIISSKCWPVIRFRRPPLRLAILWTWGHWWCALRLQVEALHAVILAFPNYQTSRTRI